MGKTLENSNQKETKDSTGNQWITAFQSKPVQKVCFFGAFFTIIITLGIIIKWHENANMKPLFFDFHVFWGAAKLVLSGQPLDVFDVPALARAAGFTETIWLPWLYGPGFLVFMTPFGILPFKLAWIAFILLSAALFALALRPFTEGNRFLLFGLVFAPANFPVYMLGQNSLLWFAACLAALWALRRQKYILAGIFIGLMTLKPQLGILIPFALIGLRAWSTIASATLTTIVLALLPTLFFGFEYWQGLFHIAELHGQQFFERIETNLIAVSPYSFFSVIGLSHEIALAMQITLTLSLALCLIWAWGKKDISFDLKAALLLCSISLSSPYILHYDLVSLCLCGFFLIRARELRLKFPDTILIILCWLGTGGAIVVGRLLEGSEIRLQLIYLPIVLLTLIVCIYGVLKRTPSLPHSKETT